MHEAGTLVMVDPFRCRMWAYHGRLTESVNEDSCKAEIDSMSAFGQLIPVLGRPVRNDSHYDYELIYGARRLFVAQCLNVPLRVEVKDLSDRECVIAIDIENQQRTQISPYERGRCMKLWLSHGLFQTQDELARALKISASQVSRLVHLASLPAVLVGAFPSPNQIREIWGVELLNAWRDPQRRQALAHRARNICRSRRRAPADEVFQQLTDELKKTPLRSPKLVTSVRDDVVTASTGETLFMIRKQRGAVSLIIPASRATPQKIAEIRDLLTGVLQAARSELVDSSAFIESTLDVDTAVQAGRGPVLISQAV